MNLYDILKQKNKKQAPNGVLPNNLEENVTDLQVGDPVIISGKGINFEGATGDVVDLGRDGRFVVVDLYNHGKHSFHSSDVSYNDYADSDEEEARMYDAGEFRDEMTEGDSSVGDAIVNLYNQIYEIGDDAVDHLYHNAPLFAQYWDQYEGDIESIVAEVSPKNLIRIKKEIEVIAKEEGLMEYAVGGDDNGNNNDDVFRKYAKMWYNGNLEVQQQIEAILAKHDWEIGELESEEGGAFIVKSGDEDGKSYMGWSAEDLQGVDEARANTAGARAGLARRANAKPLSPEEQAAKDKAKADKWLEKERAKMAAKKGALKEFAPGNGGGESGKWYSDDEIHGIVGDGWYQELDLSGASLGVSDDQVPKKWLIQQAQEWLADNGYRVQVLNVKINDDDCDWFIEGSFAKKGVAEASPETTLNLLKGLKTWQVVIMNNYYRGKYSDYSGRYYYVLASSPEEAKQVVIDNADAILQELLAMKSHNGKKILPRGTAVRITPERINGIKDGTEAGRMSTAGFKKMFGPQGPMMVKLSNGAIVDVQGQEQGVAEDNLNELSPETLRSYINKSTKDVGTLGYGLGDIKAKPGKYKDSPDVVKSVKHSFDKRIKGVEKAANRLTKQQGMAEGWDPDTTRLEQDVRDALENGDDYTAKQYAKMAPTPEAKKYLLNIIKQAMYIDDLGGETDWKGVAEDSLDEVSRGDYHKKATMGKAMAQMSAGFARSPEEREKFNQIAGRRERGLARSKARTDKFWADKAAKDEADRLEQLRAKYAGVDIDAEIARLKPAIDSAYHEYQYGARNTYSQGRDDYNSLMGRVQELERAKKALADNPPLSELSNKLLGDYKKAAGISARDLDKAGKYKQADKRFHGIVQATKKEFDNDLKKHQQDEVLESRLASMKRAGYDIK